MEKSGAWTEAMASAATLCPADRWREQLAVTVREAAEATLATVWTCPPAHPLGGSGATAPAALHGTIAHIATHQLPLVERGEDGAMWGRRTLTSEPHLPLEVARNQLLARKVLDEAYAPLGVSALAMSWLLDEEGLPLGFIAVGDGGSGDALLARLSAPMSRLARTAQGTLRDCLALARGMGAVSPPPPRVHLELLTVRERQVARLVASGYSNEGVARELAIAEQTVSVHLRRIYLKLGVHSRNELLARGVVALTELASQVPGRRSGGG